MASKELILEKLGELLAYYNPQNWSDARGRVYVSQLSSLPDDVLIASVDRHIQTGKWFPTVAELFEHSQNISIQSPPVAKPHPLISEMVMLEENCDHRPQSWNRLANKFEDADKPHCAEACRKRAEAYS